MIALMPLGGVGFWGTVIIGTMAGWLAHQVMGGRGGLVWNLIIGLCGAWLGAWAAGVLHINLGGIFPGWFVGNLVVSAIGAIVLLFLLRVLRGR